LVLNLDYQAHNVHIPDTFMAQAHGRLALASRRAYLGSLPRKNKNKDAGKDFTMEC
jgi:hypothetical protein